MELTKYISNFGTLDYIEWSAVLLSLIFLILLIKEKKWCWPFGIASSLLSIYLFIEIKLYSEAILYFYYVLIGVYGWYVWTSKNKEDLLVTTWSWTKHIPIILGGFLLSFLLGLFFKSYTDAEKTYVDASSTIFSFIASYMEAHKIFSSWVFWILINGLSIWLYYNRGLMIYSGLMVIYFVVSLYGFWDWGKKSGAI